MCELWKNDPIGFRDRVKQTMNGGRFVLDCAPGYYNPGEKVMLFDPGYKVGKQQLKRLSENTPEEHFGITTRSSYN